MEKYLAYYLIISINAILLGCSSKANLVHNNFEGKWACTIYRHSNSTTDLEPWQNPTQSEFSYKIKIIQQSNKYLITEPAQSEYGIIKKGVYGMIGNKSGRKYYLIDKKLKFYTLDRNSINLEEGVCDRSAN